MCYYIDANFSVASVGNTAVIPKIFETTFPPMPTFSRTTPLTENDVSPDVPNDVLDRLPYA